MSEKTTPIRRQYLEIKRRHPNEIVFFRLGDFYETFDEDAQIAARELDIVLTSRNVAKGERVPMAGIPHHAAEAYIGRLIGKGYRVAICEQMGEAPQKGLFPRRVVRIVTPGTVVEEGLLPGDANNYLMALAPAEDGLGIAYVDVSTGEFVAGEFSAQESAATIAHEIARLSPAEVLAPEGWQPDNHREGLLSALPAWRFEFDRCQEKLQAHFGTATLDGFGLGDKPNAVRAAGAIVDYLGETQENALALLTELSTYSLHDFMVLDAATRRNLELTRTLKSGEVSGSLLGVLDKTVTPMGRRLLRSWMNKPLLNIQRIENRLDEVDAFYADGLLRAEVRQALRGIGDLERLTNRVVARQAHPRDLVAMRTILAEIPAVRATLDRGDREELRRLAHSIETCDEVEALLERAITDEPPAVLGNLGIIRPGYANELDAIVEGARAAREWIAGLEAIERARTGIKNLKVGYNKVFGYYIEVTKANAERVPEGYIRKQTLVNAERYITPEMKEKEAQVLAAEEEMRALETRLFYEICGEIGAEAQRLLSTSRALGRLDVVSALAEVAVEKAYVRPQVVEGDELVIRDGRHPVVEELLPGKRFIPNDVALEDGERVRVITGPNMSGKSTYLRQAAHIVLMAQMGSFVPARSARIGLADRIFTRIGAQDEIHAGQSTFMVEMVETANILHNATSRSLLILDEIGRGTSTYDGVAIAWAVVEYIHNHPRLRARTFFATHYHELIQLSEILPGVRNYNVAVSEEGGRVVFLHKIVPGGADKSYGIHVAELAGLPRPVINRAQEMLSQLEGQPGGGESKDLRAAHQMQLFPLQDELREELAQLDLNALSPLEALNKLYEWQQRFGETDPA